MPTLTPEMVQNIAGAQAPGQGIDAQAQPANLANTRKTPKQPKAPAKPKKPSPAQQLYPNMKTQEGK
jgi:hypothetical protein